MRCRSVCRSIVRKLLIARPNWQQENQSTDSNLLPSCDKFDRLLVF